MLTKGTEARPQMNRVTPVCQGPELRRYCAIVCSILSNQEMTNESKIRPRAITALGIFFLVGAVLSFTSSVSLLLPGGLLESMWRLNPRAHDSLIRIGLWAVVLMFVVSVGCAGAAIDLWYGSRWGHRLAVTLIGINLLGDVANVLGSEPRAIVGVPVAVAILVYLMTTKVRRFF